MEITKPITFNTYKHHLFFLVYQLELWKKVEWKEVKQATRVIGNNLIDLYTGNLTVSEICSECLEKLNDLQIKNKSTFIESLQSNEYKKIKLSDNSVWILKIGKNEERFIHIHPAKYSPKSKRVRSSTLKTAIAVIYHSNLDNNLQTIDLKFINQIRIQKLNLSPVKSLQKNRGISQLINLFLNATGTTNIGLKYT